MTLAIDGIDVTILILYLAAVVVFGLWVGRGQRDATGFLLGGRNLPWWGVLLSIVATETSTVTFLSVPGVAFALGGDLTFLQLTIGYIIGRFIIVFLFLPHYFRGDLFTAYEVLDRRFGGTTKKTASVLFLITRNLADGLRLFLTAIVLQHVIGLELWLCVVAIGVLTIIYTFVGGMKSVVWNDCIQFFVYIAGALLAGGVILAGLPGGWSELAAFASDEGKFQLFNFSLDPTVPYTFWSGIFGGIFLTLATHGTDQLMVQRYLAAGSRKLAARALAASGFVVCGQFALFLLIGVGLACFYNVNPPDVPFERADEVFSRFIVDHLPVGIVGITLAAVFSAAMSTLSGSLNSSAAAAVNDLYLPTFKEKPSPKHVLAVSRWLTIFFGIIQIGVGIGGQYVTDTIVASVLAIAGFTTGAILGVFFLGTLTKRVSQKAALIGLVTGLAVMSYVAFRTDIAWPWFAIIGSAVTFTTGIVTSLILADRQVDQPSTD